MGKIKQWLWAYRAEITTVAILALTVLAAFQLGRLSVMYSGTSDFKLVEPL